MISGGSESETKGSEGGVWLEVSVVGRESGRGGANIRWKEKKI